MQNIQRSLFFVLLIAPFLYVANAQQPNPNNQQLFNDFTYRSGNVYRTASGKPGPEYWQNEADYKIEATLNEKDNSITGNVILTYTNNSPETLEFLWLYLEQNRFTPESRGTLTTPVQGNRYNGNVDGGYTLNKIQVDNSFTPKTIISDTRMQVFLKEPLKAKGGKVEVSMNFTYKIPKEGMDRMGRLDTKDGTVYAIAQWYPRVAVFDEVVGWNTEPYLGSGEFYCDYGDFDYKITAPYNFTVAGSGQLQNPKDVLTKTQVDRLDQASKSDKTVYIIKPEEVALPTSHPNTSGTKTWHFKMENTRDVAWAASKAFIWDAAKINLADGKAAMAHSVYPIVSDGQKAWSRSTEYTKASIEFYSNNYYPYPYATAVNVGADVGGMEYPGVSFCSYKSKGESLWGVTDHEFGHNWFPMIVGSNERRYAWMDEGFNTFINHYSTLAFNNQEYPSTLNKTRNTVRYLTFENREGIDTYPDVSNDFNLAYVAYYKPATGLFLLREYILGAERFDNAFKSYIKTWAFKHPQPNDFFNHMENVAGENLNWFWKGWFYGNGNIDIGVVEVDENKNGNVIILENKGDFPMPVMLLVTFEDGTTEQIDLPVEIWAKSDTAKHLVNGSKEISRVEFDPNKMVPDINQLNDVWIKTD